MAVDTFHHDFGRGAFAVLTARAMRAARSLRGSLERGRSIADDGLARFGQEAERIVARLAAIGPVSLPVANVRPMAALPAAIGSAAKPGNTARLSQADQFARVAGVVSSAIDTVLDTQRRQAAVAQQLDLAQYALNALSDELSAVMTVPGWRERAPVYRFEPVFDIAPVRSQSALAA